MLHILLTLLKILGWVLLAVLGLILLITLIVLFVPVRYSGRAVRETGWPEAEVSAGWLLSLIRVEAAFRDRKLSVRGQILWKTFGKSAEAEPAEEKSASEPEEAPREAREVPPKPEEIKPEAPARTQNPPGKKAEKNPDKKPDKTNKKTDQKTEKKAPAPSLDERLQGLTEKLVTRIYDLLDKAAGMMDQGEAAVRKAENKIDHIKRKAEPFTSAASMQYYRRAVSRLLSALRHYMPRRLEGYLRFGTGSADTTGELTGLAYLLLPAGNGRFEICPDFYESAFACDAGLSGRVRLCHAAAFLVKMLFDRHTWRLLRQLRGKRKGERHG